jgi:hypothetical protein
VRFGPAHEHVYERRLAGEIHRRLSGGVAASDEHDFAPRAQLRFERRSPVVDAVPFEVRDVAEAQAPITRAGGDHDGGGTHARAVIELELEAARGARAETFHRREPRLRLARQPAFERPHLDGNADGRAELLRLVERAAGQRAAGNARREPEIVLDARGRAGLAAEGARIEHGDGESFGAGVHGSREPGRTGADDRDVVTVLGAEGGQHAQALRELLLGGIAEARAVRTQHDRQGLRRQRDVGEDLLGFFVLVRIQELVRHAVAA